MFNVKSKAKNGRDSICKECKKIQDKEYRELKMTTCRIVYTKEQSRISKLKAQKKYRDNNKDKIRESSKIYDELNKEKKNKRCVANYNKIKNTEKFLLRLGNYKEKRKIILKNYYDKPENKEKKKKWRMDNKERLNNFQREYYKNPLNRLKKRLRNRAYKILKIKGLKCSSSLQKHIGCDMYYLKNHMESLFSKDMNWGNMGEWHIDHIIPLKTAKTEEDVYNLFHYTNLQPLWWSDNLSKGSKLNFTKKK